MSTDVSPDIYVIVVSPDIYVIDVSPDIYVIVASPEIRHRCGSRHIYVIEVRFRYGTCAARQCIDFLEGDTVVAALSRMGSRWTGWWAPRAP